MTSCRPFLCPLALTLVALPTALVAQSSTTSALTGTVKDPTGALLSGATVRISSPSLIGGEKVAKTAENGQYRFPMLPPGRYRILVERTGFSPLTGAETLELGRTSTLNWKFQVAAATTVEVVAVGGSADLESSTSATKNYTTEALSALPLGRDMGGIMNLTPGVNGGNAWGGDRGGANAYLMDGINVGDPNTGSQWVLPNPDWFSEVQVGGIGAPAEYGGFSGAYINSIIKRGGNDLEGTFNAYWGDSAWEAKTSNKNPTFRAQGTPTDKDWDAALSLGGPLVKDKIWYFVSGERTQLDQHPSGANWTASRKQTRLLGKLTWQVLPSATLEAFMDYDSANTDHRSSFTVAADISATYQQKSPSRTFGLNWTQTFGANLVLTAKTTGFVGRNDYVTYNGEANQIMIRSSGDLNFSDGFRRWGNPDDAVSNFRGRGSALVTLDYFKTGLLTPNDSHAFRLGVEREQSSVEEAHRFPGGYRLQVKSFGSTLASDRAVSPTYYDYPTNLRARMDRLAGFLQDTWSLSDRFQLRPGVRFEQFQGRGYGESAKIWNTRTLAPRLGATVSLTADQKNVLKFHWGRYFAGLSATLFDRKVPGAFLPQVTYDWRDRSEGRITITDPRNYHFNLYDPITNPTGTDVLSAPRTQRLTGDIDPNIKQPYQDETTLSFERKLNGPWSVSIQWLYRKAKDSLVMKNLALRADTTTLDSGVWPMLDPQTGTIYQVFNPDKDSLGNPANVVVNSNEAKRAAAFWTLSVERAYKNAWSFAGSYTHSRVYGNHYTDYGVNNTLLANPISAINSDGRLPGYNDDELKLRGSYEFPWRTRISATFRYLSGQRFTRLIGMPDNYPDTNIYDFNAEPLGSSKYPSERLLDLRIAQIFKVSKKTRLEVFVDVNNVLNSGAALSYKSLESWYGTASSATSPIGKPVIGEYYLVPSSVEQPRFVRLGARITF